MGKLASKFYDTKTFYNLSILAAPKARCYTCRKWNRRTHLFRYNGKKYCSSCAPSDAFVIVTVTIAIAVTFAAAIGTARRRCRHRRRCHLCDEIVYTNLALWNSTHH